MTRKDVWILAALLALAAGLWLVVGRHLWQTGGESSLSGPTLGGIQQLTELVTHRIEVSDVVETRINGKTGGIRAMLIVRGDVLIGVDLQQARIVSRDDAARQLVLELPSPGARSPRVDHAQTRIYQIDRWGLWCLVPNGAAEAAVADRAFRDAQAAVAKAGGDAEMIAQAKARTRKIIEEFGKGPGWEIEVRWREQ